MKPFAFEGLKWQRYYKNYVTPREWKHGSRDMPFGLGAKSLYVDAINGDDSNDGISWKTAKKKIQSAIDIAESWTNIFIKAATYNEELILSTENVHLFGEQRSTVVVSAAGYENMALQIEKDSCSVRHMTFEMEDADWCLMVEANHCSLFDIALDCFGDPAGEFGGLRLKNLTFCHLDQVLIDSAVFATGLRTRDCEYCVIENCRINLTNATVASTTALSLTYTTDSVVRKNEIVKGKFGIIGAVGSSKNTIYHNNIISSTYYLYDQPSANYWYENFIGGHTNVDNGFGIAKTPYTFSGGSDPRPVVVRNGWEFLSMGSTITDILEELELEASHASYLFPEDTDETVTFTAGGTNNTFGAWVEIGDNNAVTFSSKLASNEGHISASAIESANINGKVYLIEIAYGAAKTIVAIHRFKSEVGTEKFQLCRMRTLKIPAGETVYYRMKCETASATCEINLKYHFHS